LLEQIKELQKLDRRADTSQKVANESNTMLRQAAVYSSMQNNDLGDIANSYDMINKSEVQHLNSWKDIVQKVKEYNDYLVNQKANPLGDFSTIDFSVFGDFGNPFESALSGLKEITIKISAEYIGDLMFSANDYVNEYHWEICLRDEKIFRDNEDIIRTILKSELNYGRKRKKSITDNRPTV
jgi:uncharacterized C2H2 Zn-finger protein